MDILKSLRDRFIRKAPNNQSASADINPSPKNTTIPFLMIILLVAKFLGYLKIRVIAGLFDVSAELDIFWAAFTIPDMIFNVLVAGSINAAIIPVFSKILFKRGDEALTKLFVLLNVIISVALIVLSVIVFFIADDISNQIVSGGIFGQFLQVSGEFQPSDAILLAKLMRIMLISPMLLGASSLITAYLQVYKKFIITSLSPLLYNLGMIIGSIILVKYANLGVVGISWSVILGSLLHLLIQVPTFIEIAKKTIDNSTISAKASKFKKDLIFIFKLSLPRALALLGEQINVLINTIVSFTITQGALSAYRYAFSLHLFPAQIISGSISIVALPKLSELYTNEKYDEYRNYFNKAIQDSVFLILPFVIWFLILRLPIVRLAYNLEWWGTIFTSWSLAILSVAMLGQVIASILIRAFYSIHETKLPLISTIATIIINLAFTYFFTNFFSHYVDWRPIVGQIYHQFGTGEFFTVVQSFISDLGVWFSTRNQYDYAVGGIAMGFSVSIIFEVILNMILLNTKIKVVTWTETVKPLLVKLFISVITAILMYFVYHWADTVFDTSRTINVIIVLGVSTMAGFIIYSVLSYLFKVKELNTVVKKIKIFIPKIKCLQKGKQAK